MPSSAGRSLRDQASAVRMNSGFKSRIDKLLDSLDDTTRAEVLDVLAGEPYLAHVAVAEVLNANFAEQLTDGDLKGRHILDWRHARGIRIRQR